jgi:hypothetical protein
MARTSNRLLLAEKIVMGVWSTFNKPVPIPSYHKTPTTPQPELQPAKNLFVGLKQNNSFGLHLISQFYHAPSGLHNEGVWHNCLMGINYIQLAKQNINAEEFLKSAERLGASLYNLNFDKHSHLFRNRTHSTFWNHETSHFRHYKEDLEKNLNSNAMAIVFWSFMSHSDIDIDKMWHAIEQNFYDPQLKLWKRTTARNFKFRAVDHAILLLAAHRTLKCEHYLRSLSDERKQFLKDLIPILIDDLLHVFNYANPSKINTYIILEQGMQYKSKHHASYAQNGIKAIESDSILTKIKRFAWQDVWIALVLHILGKDITELTNDIYTTFCEDPSGRGVLYNEPRQNQRTSWGAKLCIFTGDNSLFYLLLKRQNITEHPFLSAFDNLLEMLIKEFKDDQYGECCTVAEAKQFNSPSLWASSELVFSLVFAGEVNV